MADNFFGFDTDMPALGAGGMGMGSELMEAPEDEETFDMMNDETFGDMGDGDYDWEQEHEKLTSFHKDVGENGNHDLNTDQFGLHEESLEQSISQLVVDDDEMDDPAIMTITKRQPIPQRKDVNLDNLFGPSSPPGFLSSDHLVSPGKGNIWGSPVQNTIVPPKEEGMHNLLHMLKGPSANGHHGDIQDPSIVHAGKSISGNFPDVRKYPEPEVPQARPRAMTVEQLEMEMRGETPGAVPQKSGVQLPIGTPPTAHSVQQHMQQANSRSSPITILGRGIPHSSVMNKHTPSPGAKMSPHGRGILPNSPPPGGPPFGRNDKPNGPHPPFMSNTPGRTRGPYPGPPGPGPYSDPRDMRGPHPRGPPPPPHLRQQLFNGPGRGGPRGPPPPFGPPGRGYPPRDPYGYNHNSRMMDARGDGPWRGRGDWRGGRGMPRPQRPRRDSYQSGDEDHYEDERDHSSNRDPYANLMTPREKEWIIKIQLMQLHTDNPYVDDYYFTTWQMQRLARQHQQKPVEDKKKKEEKDKKKEPKLVLPQLAKVEIRSYKPVQFEGSLGRLTSSSVHNPRQIIDVDAKVIQTDEDPKAQELRKFKQLLIHVEKTYDILLAIDELEKNALALPDEARPPVLVERLRKIATLQQRLMLESTRDNSFLKLLTLKKGIKLLSRSLPLFDKNQSSTLLLLVIQHVSLLTKKEIQYELVKGLELPIMQCLRACDLESLVVLSQTLMIQIDNKANVAANALQYEFGAVVIWNLVSRGAEIYEDVSPVDLDVQHQNEWSQFLYWVAQGVESVDRDLLCSASSPSPASLTHMQQLLDKKTFYAIEDKLHSILADNKQS